MNRALRLFLAAGLLCGMAADTTEVASAAPRDGLHDFDWDIGTWTTHQRRLLHPLTGSTTWVEYHGTDVVRKLWEGANEGVVEATGPAGRLQIFTLRYYDSDLRQWKIYFASKALGGVGEPPVTGGFANGRGAFYDRESLNGKPIVVRFAVSGISRNSCHFEQAFSRDNGKTWETNFVVDETRAKGA